jgi:hypothetical protein
MTDNGSLHLAQTVANPGVREHAYPGYFDSTLAGHPHSPTWMLAGNPNTPPEIRKRLHDTEPFSP